MIEITGTWFWMCPDERPDERPVHRVGSMRSRFAAAGHQRADRIFRATTLPDKAASDALHVALAAVNGMDFLLTWNCTHIANGVVLKIVNAICRDNGYEPPIVCTPEELLAP
ncbi:MAG TPA: hypothetical protein VGQ36_26050 [Thermoanaerobaculia bacterium]|jgi:hypothetical protein|nr:hypothetical protein [Thermoanaerobaculia bacterium]